MNKLLNRAIPFGAILSLLLSLAGCSSPGDGTSVAYIPSSDAEAAALEAADIYTSPHFIRQNFQKFANDQFGWAGIIRDVRFKETERTVQVAFLVEHRYFDWKEHSGSVPYRLLPEGEGSFTTGWIIDKPTDLYRLQKRVKVGDMLLTYGKLHSMKKGVVRINASFVHPIPKDDYLIEQAPVAEPKEEIITPAEPAS